MTFGNAIANGRGQNVSVTETQHFSAVQSLTRLVVFHPPY